MRGEIYFAQKRCLYSGCESDSGRKTVDTGKVNILHVLTSLPVGGVENMLLKVVNGYNTDRFRASICCIREGGDIAEKLLAAGYEVTILGRMKGKGFDWGAVRELRILCQKRKTDILRTHQYHANLYGRIAGVLAGVPVIIPSFHNRYCSPEKPKMHRRLLNHVLGYWSDRIVAVSEAVLEDVVRYDHIAPAKMQVIHNGVELERFRTSLSKEEARDKLQLPQEFFLIGAAGRLTEQKGHKVLIKAASSAGRVAVVVAGDGPCRGELDSLARSLGVRCFFLGRISPEQMPVFFRSLDLFCFPSLWEGFPSALVEAMAAGLPIIASDISPHREALGDAGLLVQVGGAEQLTDAIQKCRRPAERTALEQAAFSRAEIFSIGRTVMAYEALFEDCLQKKGRLHR